MVSRDTVVRRVTIETDNYWKRIKKTIANELGIKEELVTKIHAEIISRIKSQRGKISVKEAREVVFGKIR